MAPLSTTPSQPSFAAEQLLELLLQLKKTTPTAARQILNSQPAIAYALITLMVSMNAVNIDVFQTTLAEHANANANANSQPPQAYTSTPSTTAPQPSVSYSNGMSQPYSQPSQNGAFGYTQPPAAYQAYSQQYGAPSTQPAPSHLPDPLAAFPEDQKALIIRVLSMTPEQINALPPTERSAYIQLRATLGVPTG